MLLLYYRENNQHMMWSAQLRVAKRKNQDQRVQMEPFKDRRNKSLFIRNIDVKTEQLCSNIVKYMDGTENIEYSVFNNAIKNEEEIFTQLKTKLDVFDINKEVETLFKAHETKTLQELVDQKQIVDDIEKRLLKASHEYLKKYNNDELKNVKKNLNDKQLFDMTQGSGTSEKAETILKKGQNFTPGLKHTLGTASKQFNNDLLTSTKYIYKHCTGEDLLHINPKNFNSKVIEASTNPDLSKENSDFFVKIVENKNKALNHFLQDVKEFNESNLSQFYLTEEELFQLFKDNSNSILQCDKNLSLIHI